MKERNEKMYQEEREKEEREKEEKMKKEARANRNKDTGSEYFYKVISDKMEFFKYTKNPDTDVFIPFRECYACLNLEEGASAKEVKQAADPVLRSLNPNTNRVSYIIESNYIYSSIVIEKYNGIVETHST